MTEATPLDITSELKGQEVHWQGTPNLMNFSDSVTLKSTGLSQFVNGSFDQHDFVISCAGHLENTDSLHYTVPLERNTVQIEMN